MNSLYRPGNSLIHRVSAWLKLVALFLLIGSFGFGRSNAIAASSFLIITALLYFLADQGLSGFLKQLWAMKTLLVIVVVPQVIFNGPLNGSLNTVTVICGVALAALVSMTTKTSDIIDLIFKVTRSKSLALLIALSINSIALVTGFAKQIQEATLARGVKANPVRQIVTLFVISLRYADDYAESLAARGVEV